jgi:hypothetical protein
MKGQERENFQLSKPNVILTAIVFQKQAEFELESICYFWQIALQRIGTKLHTSYNQPCVLFRVQRDSELKPLCQRVRLTNRPV